MDQIFIFKTNVSAQEQVQKVAALLGSMTLIKQWNFDLEDCDRVLRVVSLNLQPALIENLLRQEGIDCEHMEYQL
ncbi:hypothetical protein [Parapedobacter tibetensis]|uniref:hypothetical protein n=1 Tax=Parapedobacter tibetensis TaxID=2972951 RepID=UPI00214DEFEA|nr:hypothetical protein [Parapedobacter tibetensis]